MIRLGLGDLRAGRRKGGSHGDKIPNASPKLTKAAEDASPKLTKPACQSRPSKGLGLGWEHTT